MFYVVRGGDLLERNVDAIVVPSTIDYRLEGYIGGPLSEMLDYKTKLILRSFPKMNPTDNVLLPVDSVHFKYVILVANPKWVPGNDYSNIELLKLTYKKALNRVFNEGISSVEFPLLSSGFYKFPPAVAIECALSELKKAKDINAGLLIYDKNIFFNNKDKFSGIKIVENICLPKIDDYIRNERIVDTEPIFYGTYDDLSKKQFCDVLSYFLAIHPVKKELLNSEVSDRTLRDWKSKGTGPANFNKVIRLALILGLNIEETKVLLFTANHMILGETLRDRIIERCIYEKLDIDSTNSELEKNNAAILS